MHTEPLGIPSKIPTCRYPPSSPALIIGQANPQHTVNDLFNCRILISVLALGKLENSNEGDTKGHEITLLVRAYIGGHSTGEAFSKRPYVCRPVPMKK